MSALRTGRRFDEVWTEHEVEPHQKGTVERFDAFDTYGTQSHVVAFRLEGSQFTSTTIHIDPTVPVRGVSAVEQWDGGAVLDFGSHVTVFLPESQWQAFKAAVAATIEGEVG